MDGRKVETDGRNQVCNGAGKRSEAGEGLHCVDIIGVKRILRRASETRATSGLRKIIQGVI